MIIKKLKEFINEGTLKFSDGEEFDTSGELRTEKRRDGWYVIGNGHLIPVDSEEEGKEVIDDMLPDNDISPAVVNEAFVRGGSPDERSIDLRGPGGNAYAILGTASNLCNQLKDADPQRYNWERINTEMTSGDYKNLVNKFEEYFGDYVTIYNADVLDESLNEEFKNPFKRKEVQIEPNFPIEEFTSPEMKIKPKEGHDLDRFYSAIEKLREKGQESRKHKLSNLFFRDFIGQDLLKSKIKTILVDCDDASNFFGMSIHLEDESKVTYTFSKKPENARDYVNINPHINFEELKNEVTNDKDIPYEKREFVYRERKKKLEEENKKVSRKDARMIGKITKKFNPNSKYDIGTGDLIIKEYESKVQKFGDYLNEKKNK